MDSVTFRKNAEKLYLATGSAAENNYFVDIKMKNAKRNTSSTQKSSDKPIRTFLKRGAAIILGTILASFYPVAKGIYDDVAMNKQTNKFQSVQIGENKASISELKKKMDDIHWYLIKRNNVKVPQSN